MNISKRKREGRRTGVRVGIILGGLMANVRLGIILGGLMANVQLGKCPSEKCPSERFSG